MQIVAHFQPKISILKRTMSPQSSQVFRFQEQKKIKILYHLSGGEQKGFRH